MRVAVLGLLATAAGCANRMPTPSVQGEPTGWSLCYEADGTVASFEGECDSPSLIKWELPAKVYLPPEYPNRLEFKEGLLVWDSWMKTEMFTLVGEAADADIEVKLGGPARGYAGYADHVKMGEVVSFNLTLFDGYYSSVVVIVHELGHTLGLMHDPGRKRSIMYPGVATDGYVPNLTPKDCEYLKALYNLRVDCRG